MTVDPVSASHRRGLTIEAWWFRSTVRTLLAVFAVWALVFARDRYKTWTSGLRPVRA